MLRKNSKFRVAYLTLALLVFVLGSVMSFYDYMEKREGMKLIGGIVFGIMAIFQAEELYAFSKNRKKIAE